MGSKRSKPAGTHAPHSNKTGGNKSGAGDNGFSSRGNKSGNKLASGGNKADAGDISFTSGGNRAGKKVARSADRGAADAGKVDLTGNGTAARGAGRIKGSVERKGRKNKHGIPLLSRKDLSFGVEPEPPASADPEGEKVPLKTSVRSGKKDPNRKKTLKKDKNGFPILAGREDLYDIFSGETIDRELAQGAGSRNPVSGPAPVAGRREKSFGDKKDRHGLPLIHDSDDLFGLFDAERFDELNPPAPPVEEQAENVEDDFEKMLEESIGKKSYRTLLLEKDDNLGRKKPLTMAQKLKRYPDPQGQLDLHGYTAYQAEERTDSYILQELKKGTKTVRIIVGKGLHSEGRAVLPDVVEDRIVDLKRKGQVFTFKWENGTKAKSGAMVVYLM